MTNPDSNFEWARRLECPGSARTPTIQKSLNHGIASLLWDELNNVLHPFKEVLEVRKSILLYKLRNKEDDQSIRYIRTAAKIRAMRSQLKPEINKFEKECEQKEFVVKQKQHQLCKIKYQKNLLKNKENLLRMKFIEMRKQVEDCKEMRLVCEHLMPPKNCKIDSNVINENLSIVGAISTRENRKMVWNKIAEDLSPIELSTLWNALLAKRTQDTVELMELETPEVADTRGKVGEEMDIGIARACGQYMATYARRTIHRCKVHENEQLIMDYIEKIEDSEANSVNVSEWLSLTLEVRKLETELSSLQSEIDTLKGTLENQDVFSEELNQLESDIHSADSKVEECVQDIQKSLALLKPAGSVIAETREKLSSILQKIMALRSENTNSDYLDIDLSTEFNIFHNTLNLEALRKIVLKDNVGAYRHAKCCMSEALLEIGPPSPCNSISQFPMMRAPIYELLNCHKNLITSSCLTRLENESDKYEYNLGEQISSIPSDWTNDIIETLNSVDVTCEKIREDFIKFDTIYNDWDNQTVQKVMALDDRIVNGATFKEWAKRYNTLLYMVHRTN